MINRRKIQTIIQSWKKQRLGDISVINYGYTAKASFEETGAKFLRITDIQNDSVNWDKVPYCSIKDSDFDKYRLIDGDIVFARTGATIGKSYLVRNPLRAVAASYLIRLRLNDPSVSPNFIAKYFQTYEYWNAISLGMSGSAQGGFNASKLSNLVVPIPPIPEQKKIVEILDEAFEGCDRAIRNTEKNLANARQLFESYLNGVFTRKGDDWIEKKLGDLCSIKHGFPFKSEFFSNKENNYILLTPGSFYESGGYRNQGSKTKYYIGEIPDGFILEKNDMLVAMTEQAIGLLGSTIIVPESDKFLHNQRLGLFQVFDDVQWNNEFFAHQFNTKKFRQAVQATASGVKVRHTSPKKLSSISVCFPPTISEQELMANKLNCLKEETQRLETIYQRKLCALQELKQSILHQAFTGELTNPSIEEAVA